jgi:hypothetical protein
MTNYHYKSRVSAKKNITFREFYRTMSLINQKKLREAPGYYVIEYYKVTVSLDQTPLKISVNV